MAQTFNPDTSRVLVPVSRSNSASFQAYQILHWGYVVLPVLAGMDKFVHFITKWEQYLAPIVPRLTGLTPTALMMIVGAIEMAAGVLVAVRPRLGAYIVALWLAAIIVNLLLIPGYYDIALRDFGLLVGALALGRLSKDYDR